MTVLLNDCTIRVGTVAHSKDFSTCCEAMALAGIEGLPVSSLICEGQLSLNSETSDNNLQVMGAIASALVVAKKPCRCGMFRAAKFSQAG